jgi:hypothetical protein
MIEAVKPGGVVLDLQVIRPNPTVEINGRAHFEINGDPLFVKADAATAAIDQLVLAGRLLEQATDDHDVRQHNENGTELIADFTDKSRTLPKSAITYLRETTQPCAIRADSGNYASHTPAITPREHHPDPTTVPPREAGSGRNTTTATSAKHSYSILQLLSLPVAGTVLETSHHLSPLRPPQARDHANQRLPALIHMRGLQPDAAPKDRRLLRLLLLRRPTLPTKTANRHAGLNH